MVMIVAWFMVYGLRLDYGLCFMVCGLVMVMVYDL